MSMNRPEMTKSSKENLQLIGLAAVLVTLGTIMSAIGRNSGYSSDFLVIIIQFGFMILFGIGGMVLIVIGFSLLPNAVYFLFKELLFSSQSTNQE